MRILCDTPAQCNSFRESLKVGRVRAALPGIAISSDFIVGFPGETDEDFEQTLDVVRQARFDQAFTFIYSPREGTPAATLAAEMIVAGGALPRSIVQERFERLVDLVQESAVNKNRALIGTTQRVLFEGVSKRDVAVLAGRSEGNKVVHVPVPPAISGERFAGRFREVCITDAQTWFLSGELTGRNDL